MSISLNQLARSLLPKKSKFTCLAVCNITGIAIGMDIPATEGFVYEYTNPLAQSSNFLKFSEQSTEELKKVSPEILAGILLALYNYHHLDESQGTAAEKNLLLQSVSSSVLVESIKFFSIQNRKESSNFVHLNLFAEEASKYSTVNDMIKNFCADCRLLVEGSPVNEATALIAEADREYRERREKIQKIQGKQPKTIQMENARAGRKLLQEIMEESPELLSSKLILLLKTSLDSSNFLLLDESMREKLTKALLRREGNTKCAALARILNDGIKQDDLFSIFEIPSPSISPTIQIAVEENKTISFKEKLLLNLASSQKREKSLKEEVEEELSNFVEEDSTEEDSTEEKGEENDLS